MEMVAKTFFGLEELLEQELIDLGAEKPRKLKRAVAFKGDMEMLYKANLHLRTAISVLMPITKFRARNEDELYKGVRNVDWFKYFDQYCTFIVDAVAVSKIFNHSHYVSLKTKDAIVDQFRAKHGRRPSVSKEQPNVKINIHIREEEVTISLDSSSDQLFKRTYRSETGAAPLNESMAAALIMMSGWDKKEALLDPMCGSGTLLTEAGLIARNVAAGKFREWFGFMGWKEFDSRLWRKVRKEAYEAEVPSYAPLYAADIQEDIIEIAKDNASGAGLRAQMKFKTEDFFESAPPRGIEKGMIIMNPPYGERLVEDDLNDMYRRIGDKLKQDYTGFTAWIISSDLEALKHVGLKTSEKIKVFNGPLECRFEKFDLHEGSLKPAKQNKTI